MCNVCVHFFVVTRQVCHGIDRSVVNWDLVTMEPSSSEEKTNNAKYAISVARKLGACVFVAAEDIVQVSGVSMSMNTVCF